MKFNIKRDGIEMTPDCPMDIAFIEDTLGLKKEGDLIPFKRIAPCGLSHAIAYIEAKKMDK
jgi:hypothetical protein